MSITQSVPDERGASPGWLIALGVLMIVLGVIGIGMAYWLTLAAVIWFGVLTIVAGVAQLFDVVHHKGWKSIVWHILIGVLYIIAGAFMIFLPVNAAFILTIVIALSFIATGIVRLVMAFGLRGSTGATIWLVLSAIVSIALGVILWSTVTPPGAEALATPEGQLAWVRSWGWIIGLIVSIELISQGFAMFSLGIVLRRRNSTGTGATGAAAA
jgi:uncharacterized membrane protein HdeD (DUF308 family)